ncbi:MAG: hypothetical protein KatS3mg001_098 [Candidatus Pacearchaeota archaeon]|nr:MAG: hypothetical protein KatS3mg001_098 [Candidatus Pacearchaeota archaeon]
METATAPAFSFSADTDNGMFLPTTNQLALFNSRYVKGLE